MFAGEEQYHLVASQVLLPGEVGQAGADLRLEAQDAGQVLQAAPAVLLGQQHPGQGQFLLRPA